MIIYDQKKNSFMNILVSFMNIYDHSQREAQINLWEFVAHWWTFMTPKKREAQKKEEHLCFIDDLFRPKNREAKHSKKFLIHWWTFMTKRKKTFMPVYD